jgi:hypothetical protein
MDALLRPMSTSQLLDRTFELYRSNFMLFVGIALPAAALNLAGGLVEAAIQSHSSLGPIARREAAVGLISLCWIVVNMAGQAVASGATVYSVSALHLSRPISIREAYRMLGASFGNVFKVVAWVSLKAFWLFPVGIALWFLAELAGLSLAPMIGAPIVVVAAACVAIPVYLKCALAVPACAVERIGPREAVRRSGFLTEGAWGRVFLIYLLSWVISAAMTYLLRWAPRLLTYLSSSPAAARSLAALQWNQVAQFLANTFVGPVLAIALSVLYYDQRVRKEAFDLQLMMESLEAGEKPSALASGAG